MKKSLKKHQQALLIGLVLILLIITYFKREDIKAFFDKSPQPYKPNSVEKTPTTSNNSNLLQRGSTGEQVRKLQVILNDHHRQHKPTFIPLLTEDGVFGSKTESMLEKYTGKTAITLSQLTKALK